MQQMVESRCSYLVEQFFFATKNEAGHWALTNFRSVSENPVLTQLCLHSTEFWSLVGLQWWVELVMFTGGGVQIWAWCLGGAKILSLSSVSSCSYVTFCVRLRCSWPCTIPISEQVAKIHRCFVIRGCDLHPFSYNCCHTPNKLDSSANEIYGI